MAQLGAHYVDRILKAASRRLLFSNPPNSCFYLRTTKSRRIGDSGAFSPRRRDDRIRLATSGFGAFEPSMISVSSVAIWGKADVARTSHFGSDGPKANISDSLMRPVSAQLRRPQTPRRISDGPLGVAWPTPGRCATGSQLRLGARVSPEWPSPWKTLK